MSTFSEADILRFRACAEAMADAARAAILPFFRAENGLKDKGAHVFDPVTEADQASEAAMRAIITARFPDHGILGEEFGEQKGASGFQWVLDPIDGTRAFISGLPLWGVLIALNHEGEPFLGVMDQPFMHERFVGFPGGAELVSRDGVQPLKTRNCASLSEATLATTDPFLFKDEEQFAFQRLRAATKLQRYGTDCYAYCMLAAGHIDIVIESGLKPYDIQALIPIIRGAGGDVTSWNGQSAAQGGRVLALGDGTLSKEAQTLLQM